MGNAISINFEHGPTPDPFAPVHTRKGGYCNNEVLMVPIKKKSARNTVKSPPPPSTRQAVIYVRVSCRDQEDEGFSIPSQLKLLHDYARKMGLVVAQEFGEAETAKCAGRTQYTEMLRHLGKSAPTRKCRVLQVEKTDRLYRNWKHYVILDES